MDAGAENAGYRYNPLTSPQSIRLLRLEPSVSQSKPIECLLTEVRLDDCRGLKAAHSYEALSYVWGDRHGSIPIACGRQQLLVTPNCESALRHLRHRFKPRTLWVDAICINQQSVEEKNKQVPLMGKIYSIATQVIIWLGPGLPGDEDILARARLGSRLYHTRGHASNQILPGKTSRNLVSKIITPEEIVNTRRICNNACFTRIWTLQELLLATSAVFQIGRSECPTSQLYSYYLVAEALAGSRSSDTLLFQIRNRLLETLQPHSARSRALICRVRRRGRMAESDPTEFLATTLQLAALSDATDSRDKVYGMYGLLQRLTGSKGVSLPTVDYTRTVEEVYEGATRSLIQVTRSLWPLETITRSRATNNGMPSWVPDLRDPSEVGVDWQPQIWRNVISDAELSLPEASKLSGKLENRMKKALGSRARTRPTIAELTACGEERRGKLPVKAKYLAEIAEAYTRMPTVGRGAPDGKLLREKCLEEWNAAAALLESEQGEQPRRWRYFGALQELTPALNYLRAPHDAPVYRKPGASADNGRNTDADEHHPEDIYDGAILFRTTCGLLGISKGNVQPKDKIWQLAGGRYPFVLHRELQPTALSWWMRPLASEERLYKLVGIADVHNLDAKDRKTFWAKDYDPRHYHDITLI